MATNFFGDDFFSGAFFSNSAQSQKRLSAINLSCPWRGPNVAAQDASFTLGNRAGAAFMYASFDTPVPPATVDYQGDGKKRRKKRRNRTQELFDGLERTLRALVYGEPSPQAAVSPRVAKAAAGMQERVNAVMERMASVAAGDADLQKRLAGIRTDFLTYMAKRAAEDDEDDDEQMMMMH